MSSLRVEIQRVVREHLKTPSGLTIAPRNSITPMCEAIYKLVHKHNKEKVRVKYEVQKVMPSEYQKLTGKIYRLEHELKILKGGA